MAHQFVFTSLDKTLGGGPGFGIVGMSPGFPEALRSRAMGMVSYEGIPGGSPAARVSTPVNWFGLKMEAGTKAFFVLGRIGSAPNDYSGRRNHIAHLLLLDPIEAASVHPASLLREFAWIDSWHGPARPLPIPVLAGTPTVEPVSRQWLRLTGDGGYAGAAWDAMEHGRPFAFVHEGLDDATLRDLVIETLSQAPNPDAWRLKFATLAGDFTEGKQSDLAGAVLGSRLADLWSTQRTPHIVLSAVPRILPKAIGSWADAARSGFSPLTPQRNRSTTSTRVRPAATIVPSETVEAEPIYMAPTAANTPSPGSRPQPVPPDPMRLLIPGGIGFFLGMLFTGVLVGLGMYSFWHLRDQAQIAQDGAAQAANQKAGQAANQKPELAANAKVANGAPENKGDKIPGDAADPKAPQANAQLQAKDAPKIRQMVLPPFLQTPFALARFATGLFSREPLAPPEVEAQARMIRKLKNMQGWNAIEKDLIRADRVWELSRTLQTIQPPLPDPFTHDRLDKLTTPEAEDAWVVEAAGLLPFGTRDHALAYLSLVANRERVLVRVKKIEERTKGDKTLAPHLDKLKEILDLYKNH